MLAKCWAKNWMRMKMPNRETIHKIQLLESYVAKYIAMKNVTQNLAQAHTSEWRGKKWLQTIKRWERESGKEEAEKSNGKKYTGINTCVVWNFCCVQPQLDFMWISGALLILRAKVFVFSCHRRPAFFPNILFQIENGHILHRLERQ